MIHSISIIIQRLYKKHSTILIVVLTFLATVASNASDIKSKKAVVVIPVANLRGILKDVDPRVSLPTTNTTNAYQHSQMLLGEYLNVHQEQLDAAGNKWLFVSALQQQRYRPELGWHGFPGWVQANQVVFVNNFVRNNLVVSSYLAPVFDQLGNVIFTLSVGTRLQAVLSDDGLLWNVALPDGRHGFVNNADVYKLEKQVTQSHAEIRNGIIATAATFLDNFYSWGGRSAQSPAFGNISSVDCSSFTNLVYLSQGLEIPRNAHDQYLMAHGLKHGYQLAKGDLVFFGHQNDQAGKQMGRINHVMMYMGDGNLIEASMSAGKVRIISFVKRIGKSHESMKSGDMSHDVTLDGTRKVRYRVYFASYVHRKELLQKLRDACLKVY